MIGLIGSLVERTDPAVSSGLSAEQGDRATIASPDQELIALCQNFKAKLREWMKQVGKHGIDGYDETTRPGRTLHALRTEWGNSLAALRSVVPCTAAGATEKLSAAQAFLAFSCEADGSAFELLALATRELDQVNDVDRASDRTQTSHRRNANGPFLWLERLKRRV